MTNQIIEVLQPIVITVVTAIVGLLASYALVAVNKLKDRAAAWLDARTTESDRQTLHKIAQEAFAYAETAFTTPAGDNKLEAALGYAIDKLQAVGIQLSQEEIKAAIHDAWLKYDQGQQAAGLKPNLYNSEIDSVKVINSTE